MLLISINSAYWDLILASNTLKVSSLILLKWNSNSSLCYLDVFLYKVWIDPREIYFLYIFGDISIWFFSELGKGFFQNGNCFFQSFAVNIELVSVIFGFYEIFLVRIFNSYIKGLLRACRNWNPLFIQNLFQERVIVGAGMGIKIRHLHIAMCGPFKIDEKTYHWGA